MSILKIYLVIIGMHIASVSYTQTNYKTLSKDFQKLSGSWQGSLTYLDYTSGNPYTMPANIDVKRISNTNQFTFFHIYPDEMNANSTDTVVISKDGKYIDLEFVKSRRKLNNGVIEIITEEIGTDGNDHKPATFKHTYTLSKNIFKIRKDVQFIGENDWIKRHEYSYTRK